MSGSFSGCSGLFHGHLENIQEALRGRLRIVQRLFRDCWGVVWIQESYGGRSESFRGRSEVVKGYSEVFRSCFGVLQGPFGCRSSVVPARLGVTGSFWSHLSSVYISRLAQ